MDCSPPGPSVHGTFQARVPEWGAIAFSDIVFESYLNTPSHIKSAKIFFYIWLCYLYSFHIQFFKTCTADLHVQWEVEIYFFFIISYCYKEKNNYLLNNSTKQSIISLLITREYTKDCF